MFYNLTNPEEKDGWTSNWKIQTAEILVLILGIDVYFLK